MFNLVRFFKLLLFSPRIENGSFNSQGERSYDEEPLTHYQNKMRQHTDGVLLDHITEPLTPLDVARIELIPEGGDWRDLPNIETELEDGTTTQKLVYPYKNIHYKNNIHGRNRGVCPCMEKEEGVCDKQSRTQKNTLIPWFMAHSGSRNNDYAGCYGRVPKNGIFATVTTDPCPDGKQGRVVHPDQNRLLSVREFARAQGFPDHYVLCGELADKFRQGSQLHILNLTKIFVFA